MANKKGSRLSRRAVVGGLSLTAVGATALVVGTRSVNNSPVGNIDTSEVRDLDEGFYMVDGWVLTRQDLDALPR